MLLTVSAAAGADTATQAAACYNLPTSDARATCLARVHRDPGRCFSVQDAAARAQCLAEVRQ